jgi:hypothetical protein
MLEFKQFSKQNKIQNLNKKETEKIRQKTGNTEKQ